MNTDAMTRQEVVALIDGLQEDERWAGNGYLRERLTARAEGLATAQSDRFVLSMIERNIGVDLEAVFQFCNSRPGRWFGELAFSEVAVHDIALLTDFCRDYKAGKYSE